MNRRREIRTVQVSLDATNAEVVAEQGPPGPGFWQQLQRHVLAVPLLIVCWVTWWTLMEQFSGAMHESFWLTAEFWNFAIGILLMIGWFASGLLATFFLSSYVLGHELTHLCCVYLCLGKVTGFHFSSEGGYVITTKTNLLIALSPYFVPFYSLLVVAGYLLVKLVWALFPELGPLSPQAPRIFYLLLGLTWTFHMVWTLWMLPRDQPDLKEHGTVFSLVVIFLGNLVMLSVLLCVTRSSDVAGNFASFGQDWLQTATWMVERGMRAAIEFLERVPS